LVSCYKTLFGPRLSDMSNKFAAPHNRMIVCVSTS
jgi:hypothetical protein